MSDRRSGVGRWSRAGVLALSAAVGTAGLGGGAAAGVIHEAYSEATARAFGNARPFQSVGQFIVQGDDTQWAGSGTYLGDRWVVTAAHVAEDATGMRFRIDGQERVAEATYVHPGWDKNRLLAGHDLALVRLSEDLPTVTPATRLTGRGDAGRFGASVGFGRSGDARTGFSTTTSLLKRGGRNVIDGVLNNNILLSDFDSGDLSNNALGNRNPQPYEYLIAPGDSGGGLFVYKGRQWVLAGVHSFGWGKLDGLPNADYGDVSGHTRVLFYNRWMDRVLAGAGETRLASGQRVSTSLYAATGFSGGLVPEPGVLAWGAVGAGVLVRRRRG